MQEVNAQELFERKSRSFSLAARLFTKEMREAIARLYSFCRYVDDLADATEHGQPELLAEITEGLRAGTPQTGNPELKDFLELSKANGLPLQAAAELTEALRADCGACALQSKEELIRFAYGVAGTVGLLMRPLLGAKDVRAVPFAIDLGIALQLTNVARDISEDAARDRFYLPAEWVAPGTLREALDVGTAGTEGAVRKVDAAVQSLLGLASDYYESARRGFWFIPPRNRLAVFFAAEFYQAIGNKMERQGLASWRKRVRLGLFGKLRVAGAAFPRYLRMTRTEWSHAYPPLHAAHLHAALNPE